MKYRKEYAQIHDNKDDFKKENEELRAERTLVCSFDREVKCRFNWQLIKN